VSETFILFTIAGTTYALRTREVAHVEMIDTITPVPNAAEFVDGVVFSRGSVVPAMNLRVRFGFERAPYDLRTRLLVVQSGGRSVGLIVDAAREFLSLETESIQPPGAGLTGLSGRYLDGVVNIGDRLILVLNLGEVLTFDNPTLAGSGRSS